MVNRDFTFLTYRTLITEALKNNYKLTTVENLFTKKNEFENMIILRHDVDKKPEKSLIKAKLEAEYNIQSTYYFRIVKKSYNKDIISEIAKLGHEIGYHYENLAEANGHYNLAIRNFEENLSKLRKFYPVKTICMHGSPLSKWDNKKLWEKYNYKDFGIIVESYLDIDFNEIFYLTDTGRSWNNKSASIRDKVQSNFTNNYNSTEEIIEAIKNGSMPNKIMINTHPQRWSNNIIEWNIELISQTAKNVIKRLIINKIN